MDDGKVRRWLECRGSDWMTGRNVGKLWEQHVAQMIRNRLLGYKVIKAGTLMCSAQSVLGLLNMLLNWAVLDTEKRGWVALDGRREDRFSAGCGLCHWGGTVSLRGHRLWCLRRWSPSALHTLCFHCESENYDTAFCHTCSTYNLPFPTPTLNPQLFRLILHITPFARPTTQPTALHSLGAPPSRLSLPALLSPPVLLQPVQGA